MIDSWDARRRHEAGGSEGARRQAEAANEMSGISTDTEGIDWRLYKYMIEKNGVYGK